MAVVGAVCLDAEDPAALGVENAFSDEIVDVRIGLECGVHLDQGFRPKQPRAKVLVDALPDQLVPDRDEAVRVGLVILDQRLTWIEDVH